jgi:hypothetical protein
MKALSIKQPWAWLIVNGYKPLENRSWKTKFTGDFLVQAGLTFDMKGWAWVVENLDQLGIDYMNLPEPDEYEKGAIIGKATITDCISESDSPWFFGPYGFKLESAEVFDESIPCKGRLGFFEVKI